jgi:hypothetical protein
MPRVGLPTRSEEVQGRAHRVSGALPIAPSSSPIQMGAVALGAVAFRAVSALSRGLLRLSSACDRRRRTTRSGSIPSWSAPWIDPGTVSCHPR